VFLFADSALLGWDACICTYRYSMKGAGRLSCSQSVIAASYKGVCGGDPKVQLVSLRPAPEALVRVFEQIRRERIDSLETMTHALGIRLVPGRPTALGSRSRPIPRLGRWGLQHELHENPRLA